jgi:predicted metal-dependent phosphoesterase TrpH
MVFARLEILSKCFESLNSLEYTLVLDAKAGREERKRATRQIKRHMEQIGDIVERGARVGLETKAYYLFMRKSTVTFDEAKTGAMVAIVADLRSLLVKHGSQWDKLFSSNLSEKNAHRLRLIENACFFCE